jgi:cytochrome c-type protein NapB
MKKVLVMSLLGLLSLSIQSNVIAEDVTQTTEKKPIDTSSTQEDAGTVEKTSATAVDSSSNKANNLESGANSTTTDSTSEEVVPEVVKASPVEILGKSLSVYSLRGYNKVDSESEIFPNRRNMVVDGGISVTFGDQPPMVPHSIDKDRISLQENTCLKCHSKAASKLEMGPKPTSSHFRGRDGKQQKTLVANRYFCTQCHTPQAHTQPLVKNNFTN